MTPDTVVDCVAPPNADTFSEASNSICFTGSDFDEESGLLCKNKSENEPKNEPKNSFFTRNRGEGIMPFKFSVTDAL